MNNYQLALVGLFAIFGSGFSLADLGVEDPTRPVYEQSKSFVSAEMADAALLDADDAIPELTQLIFSSERQLAMFGDILVRAGDSTAFGTIIAIKKDRVLVQTETEIKEVVFFDQ